MLWFPRRASSSASLSCSIRDLTRSSTRPPRLSRPSLRTLPPSRVRPLRARTPNELTAFSPASASCLISLILQEPSNNVKMIVLERVALLHSKHEHVLDELVMDILCVLASPDMEVRRKALAIALEMISSRNVEEVVGFLKKELVKTLDGQFEKVGSSSRECGAELTCLCLQNPEYRQLLIQTIHTCAIKHSEVASNVVHVLMEFLGDANNASAVDVIAFVREVVEKFPALRSGIVEKLLSTFNEIKSGKVFRGALWIVGEYGNTVEDIKETMQQIRKVLGEVPILASEQVCFSPSRWSSY